MAEHVEILKDVGHKFWHLKKCGKCRGIDNAMIRQGLKKTGADGTIPNFIYASIVRIGGHYYCRKHTPSYYREIVELLLSHRAEPEQ